MHLPPTNRKKKADLTLLFDQYELKNSNLNTGISIFHSGHETLYEPRAAETS
jgi:hypothetical protein